MVTPAILITMYLVVLFAAIYYAMKNLDLKRDLKTKSTEFETLSINYDNIKSNLEITQDKFDVCTRLKNSYEKKWVKYLEENSSLNKEINQLIKYGPNTLNFAVGKDTFHEINRGFRKFVYREAKPYWEKRLMENGKLLKFDAIQFINGKEGKSLFRVNGDVETILSDNAFPEDRVDLKDNTKYFMFVLGERIA